MKRKDIWMCIALASALLLGLEVLTVLPLRVRVVLGVHAGVLGLLSWIRRRQLLSATMRAPVAIGFVVSLLPVVLVGVLAPREPLSTAIGFAYPTIAGWVAFLALLPLANGDGSHDDADWTPSRLTGIAFVALAFVGLAIAHWLAVGKLALVSDEVVFLTQAKWMRFPEVTLPISGDLAPFFRMRKVDYLNGHLFGMYPPGWPALLAAFGYFGLEWWSSVVLGTVSLILVYRIGVKLYGARLGALAALLLATSQVYVVTHAGYMSHAPGIAGLLGAMLFLLEGLSRSGWPRFLLWVGAGVLFGFVVTVRPLTGIGVGMSIGLWMLVRAWKQRRDLPWQMATCVALGGLVMAAPFIAYNLTVFGKALTTGHSVMHPGLYSLGFGVRGFRVLDEDLNWVSAGNPFTPIMALSNLLRRIAGMNTSWVPIGLLLPLVVTAVAAGYRLRWWRVVGFSILPALLFFYWAGSLRQYVELLPFFMLAMAGMLLAIYSRWPRMAAGLLGTVLAAQVVVALPWRRDTVGGTHRAWADSDYGPTWAPGRWATLMKADSLAREDGPLLLFSQEGTRFDNQIDRLYIFNNATLDGPIVVARDRGALNEQLMERFPGRKAYVVKDGGWASASTFTPIESAAGATAPVHGQKAPIAP